jgi:hypothetical protein
MHRGSDAVIFWISNFSPALKFVCTQSPETQLKPVSFSETHRVLNGREADC